MALLSLSLVVNSAGEGEWHARAEQGLDLGLLFPPPLPCLQGLAHLGVCPGTLWGFFLSSRQNSGSSPVMSSQCALGHVQRAPLPHRLRNGLCCSHIDLGCQGIRRRCVTFFFNWRRLLHILLFGTCKGRFVLQCMCRIQIFSPAAYRQLSALEVVLRHHVQLSKDRLQEYPDH